MKMEVKRSARIVSLIMVFMVCIAMSFVALPQDTVYGASIGKVPKLYVEMDKTKIELSWTAAKNAKKYQVFRASSKNGKYKHVKTVSARKCKLEASFGLRYYKVRGVSSSGSVKGACSAAKPMYGILGLSQVYKASYAMQTIVQVGLINGTKSNPTNKGIYMMGKKSANVTYAWYIVIVSKSTGKDVKTYKAVQCNSMATVINSTYIGKNVKGSVMCSTYPGTVIPSKYLDTNKYKLFVMAPFTFSSNINKGMAFYAGCGPALTDTGCLRWR